MTSKTTAASSQSGKVIMTTKRETSIPSLSRLSSSFSTTTYNEQQNLTLNDSSIIDSVLHHKYFGAYLFLVFHFLLIAFGVIETKSPFATGTVTCHTYFYGWLLIYYLRITRRQSHQRLFHKNNTSSSIHSIASNTSSTDSDDDSESDLSTSNSSTGMESSRRSETRQRFRRSYYDTTANIYMNHDNHHHDLREGGIVLVLLFQLAVGAGAFSRLYYGPFRILFNAILGADNYLQDRGEIFQSLSAKFLQAYTTTSWGTPSIVQWFIDTVEIRYSSCWFLCDFMDIVAHQIPFLLLCFVISRHHNINNSAVSNNWKYIIQEEIQKYWYYGVLIGPIHRLIWDYCTCGHLFCDGPYQGYLQIVPNHEQFLWHFVPCLGLVMYFLMMNHSSSRTASDDVILIRKSKQQ